MNDKTIQSEIRTMLDANRAFDYDELQNLLSASDDEQFDLIVRLSFHLSCMNLTESQVIRAAKKIANLAVAIFSFNLAQESSNETIVSSVEDFAFQAID